MKLRSLAILVGIGAVAMGGYAVYWHVGATAVEDLVLSAVAQERNRGLRVEHAPIERSGFPFHVRLRVADAEVEDAAAGWAMRIPELSIDVAPWRPLRQEVKVQGPVEARLRHGNRPFVIDLNADRLDGRVDLSTTGRISAIGLVGRALRGAVKDANGASSRFTLDVLDGDYTDMDGSAPLPEGAPAPVSEVLLSLRGLTADGPGMVLGTRIERIGLRAVLKGRLPSASDPAVALERWRDGGGVVEMPWLALDWGKLGLTGNGAVALDEWLRPLGSVALKVAGFRETLGDLAQAGVIDGRSAGAVGLAMSLFARTPPEGGPPVIDTVLRMQDGEVALGPFRLGRLSPVLGMTGSAGPQEAALPAAAPEPAVERVSPPPPVDRLIRPLAPPPQLAPNWAAPQEPAVGTLPSAQAPAD